MRWHVQRVSIFLNLGDALTLLQTMRATGMSKTMAWCLMDRLLIDGGGSLFI